MSLIWSTEPRRSRRRRRSLHVWCMFTLLEAWLAAFPFHQNFRELWKDSKSYLQADRPAVIFEGFSEISRLCTHVTVKNTGIKPVAFNVRKPEGLSFGVSQKLGIIKPKEEMQLYFQFRSRASRMPDDGVHLYTIYQTRVHESEMKALESNETPRERYRLARKIWSSYTGDCLIQLHLPVGFAAKRLPKNLAHAAHNNRWMWREEATPALSQPGDPETPQIEDLDNDQQEGKKPNRLPSPAAGSQSAKKSSELPSATADDGFL